jgi:hypothetical protein
MNGFQTIRNHREPDSRREKQQGAGSGALSQKPSVSGFDLHIGAASRIIILLIQGLARSWLLRWISVS